MKIEYSIRKEISGKITGTGHNANDGERINKTHTKENTLIPVNIRNKVQ